MPTNENYKNREGYSDPTAYQALNAATAAEIDEEIKQVNALITTLKYIIRLAGFELDERIALRHRRSRRLYK